MTQQPVWNNEAIAAAKKHNGLKYSRSEIADGIYEDTGMRFSRNAVIGKLARLGVACQKPKKIRNHAFNRPARAPVNAQHIQRDKKFKSSASRTVSKLFGPEDY